MRSTPEALEIVLQLPEASCRWSERQFSIVVGALPCPGRQARAQDQMRVPAPHEDMLVFSPCRGATVTPL